MTRSWPRLLSLAVLVLAAIAAFAPQLLAPGDPLAITPLEAFTPPSPTHPFGTDESGRDMLTRVVHGASTSVGIGIAATLIGVGFGGALGFLAGLGPRSIDVVLARLFEVLFALPTLVLALLFISLFGGGTTASVIAIGIATIPGYARMLRARVRMVRESAYVEWARLDGASRAHLFVRHLAPNTLWPLVSAATLGVGQAIIWVSALGFLGLGAAPPAPEWGAMLNAGRVYLTSAWWMTFFPGLAIVAVAAALTVLGRSFATTGAASRRSEPASASPPAAPSPTSAPSSPTGPLATDALFDVRDLTVSAPTGAQILSNVSVRVNPGECLAIVGESGAGKSVLARTLIGLTQAEQGWSVASTTFSVDGRDLRGASARTWRQVRGRRIALVLQDALQSLDPLRTVGAEVGEALRLRGARGDRLRTAVMTALESAGLDRAAQRMRQRPFELSGGMRQRALIASALVADPHVIIADEPTTALDAVTAHRIGRLLRSIVDAGGSVVLISHDLGSVARIADRIAVLDTGRIVEEGTAAELLSAPRSEKGRALVSAIPSGPKPPGRRVRGTELLRIERGSLTFAAPDGSRSGMFDVSVRLFAGDCLGIVGESGAGKTTLGRVLVGATVLDEGRQIDLTDGTDPLRVRLVPQDPLSTFDPRLLVGDILRDTLRRAGRQSPGRFGTGDEPTAEELLGRVGLPSEFVGRSPSTLSGGQRQRVAIARALAADPDVLVCDEAVSALDMSTQAEILDLLRTLQDEHGLALVFISHDLAAVRSVADRMIVMRDGRIVEEGDTEAVVRSARDPFTRALIEASVSSR